MAKPKSPLLSLGARGTIGDALTFQKRGRGTIAREKPIPKDPRSKAQLAQRQRYKDAVAVWHALTPEEKEAWRGVCPGLTAYQCFMSSELKYVPPPIPIDIGSEAIDRAGYYASGDTAIVLDNPATASGTITSVEIWAYLGWDLSGCKVGIFYKLDVRDFRCRSSATLGNVISGSKQVFPVSLAVESSDFIGMFFSGGYMESDYVSFDGLYYKTGDHCNTGDLLLDCAILPGDTLSLYGTGAE